MKKKYMKPEQRIILLQHQQHLLAGSGVTGVNGNGTGIEGGGGSNTINRARSYSGWDDDWDE